MVKVIKAPIPICGTKWDFRLFWNNFLIRSDMAIDMFIKNYTLLNNSGNKMDKVVLICGVIPFRFVGKMGFSPVLE